jgi:hypothetical protein
MNLFFKSTWVGGGRECCGVDFLLGFINFLGFDEG